MMRSAVVIFMSISRFFRKVVCPSPAITTGALWITSNGWRALLPALVFDTDTHARTIKKSGEFYARMIAEHGITGEMAAEVEKEVYPNG